MHLILSCAPLVHNNIKVLMCFSTMNHVKQTTFLTDSPHVIIFAHFFSFWNGKRTLDSWMVPAVTVIPGHREAPQKCP